MVAGLETNMNCEVSNNEDEDSYVVTGSGTVFNDVTDQDSNLDEAGGDYQSE